MAAELDKVVVITGASSGVGRACAQEFAARGYALVLAARRAHALEDLAEECRARYGIRVRVAPTDVTDVDAVEQLAQGCVAEFGRIDVWLNSAAVAAFGALDEVPRDIFRQVMDVNVLGCVNGARAALRVMREQRTGTVVNVSSVVGAAVVPYNTPYVLSKAAVRALGGSLRQELRLAGLDDVHVCTLLPATMDTPFFRHAANYSGRAVTPMAPVYTARRAARTVVRLAERPRREAYVGPAGRVLGIQSKLTPAFAERVLAHQMDRSHLSRTRSAAPTDGNVVRPLDDVASSDGGWHGRRRTAVRRAGAVTLAAGLTAVGLSARRAARGRGRCRG
ncbi:SDR family NAD(P)-dependent oxidoreductase [Streptomyces candidus]|uniref:Short-subunit dehydrogenase n=1 Tax=Streptomyces candidus TaxID=67283 RepID=A0A7X0LP60_9ACTN|nr:SDR family NAD(P)-dependent oxidoreductase [Streptomyces candidus]MBB6434581.1 short-subunit dehydrogenase [Streptomyces candidus]GHH36186.1 short-chain dehydrogenase [Streptomyces candidus]